MPRKRDSIYNVSTDIRLEDYTEDSEKERNYAGIIRFIGGLILIALIGWGIYSLSSTLFAPEYQLAITNEEASETQMAALSEVKQVRLSAARPVFIRFQWEEGQLSSDYLKIRVLQDVSGQEVAVMGRMTPVTVNYILFAGPLEAGDYQILVEDRGGSELAHRKFSVR